MAKHVFVVIELLNYSENNSKCLTKAWYMDP